MAQSGVEMAGSQSLDAGMLDAAAWSGHRRNDQSANLHGEEVAISETAGAATQPLTPLERWEADRYSIHQDIEQLCEDRRQRLIREEDWYE